MNFQANSTFWLTHRDRANVNRMQPCRRHLERLRQRNVRPYRGGVDPTQSKIVGGEKDRWRRPCREGCSSDDQPRGGGDGLTEGVQIQPQGK